MKADREPVSVTRRALFAGGTAIATAAIAGPPSEASPQTLSTKFERMRAEETRLYAVANALHEKTYPNGYPQRRPLETDADYTKRTIAAEIASGYDAAQDAADALSADMGSVAEAIARLPLTTETISIKARVALWEAPPTFLEARGMDNTLVCLQQLAAWGAH